MTAHTTPLMFEPRGYAERRSQARTARKAHRCGGCDARINPGDRYLRWVTFPSDGVWDRIATMAECAACATRYGRADRLGGAS